MPSITALTCAVLVLLLTALSLQISRLRIRYKQSFGSGGHKDLQVAIRAHGNTLEQSVVFVLLLLILELMRPGAAVIAWAGSVFVVARLLHSVAIFQRKLLLRQIAHVISMLCQLGLALGLIWILMP